MHLRYKRMIEGMARKAKRSRRKSRRESWVVYMLRCADRSLYTGVTNDLARRFKMHREGKGARYTRIHPPLKVVYREKVKGRAAALVREFEIKSLSKKSKEKLAIKKS